MLEGSVVLKRWHLNKILTEFGFILLPSLKTNIPWELLCWNFGIFGC